MGGSAEPNYIEDVFSTWLYTGNGATQTINTGMSLSGEGGLVWIKQRSATNSHAWYDTARGATKDLASNLTAGETIQSTGVTSFTATGFAIGALAKINTSEATYASWTFRKQSKFFDIVTYTGNGANRTIAHNLESVPGCIMVKRTDTTANWQVYHRSLANTQYMVLNSVAAAATGATRWNSTTPTDTVFSLGTDVTVNASGGTYVAYIFAHNAGGFGLTDTDNVISCGSYTGNGSSTGPVVNLGFEPQWLLIKSSTVGTAEWLIFDNMRGLCVGTAEQLLQANATAAEVSINRLSPTPTGFQITSNSSSVNTNGGNYTYIAIRRGQMRTPTTGTSVFSPNIYTENGSLDPTFVNLQFSPDLAIFNIRNIANTAYVNDRLRGNDIGIFTALNLAEQSSGISYDILNGVQNGALCNFTDGVVTGSIINWFFKRAPRFFDQICYTGDGTPGLRQIPHNLAVKPELIINKTRSTTGDWQVTTPNNNGFLLNTNAAANGITYSPYMFDTYVTPLGMAVNVTPNVSGVTYVAYLFASCPGVSKVFSYTGNGTTQTIDCGFAGGARFILIKRTDSTGDWYVWDTARGIVSGNDPHLSLNVQAAEVTSNDTIDTHSTGFVVNQVAATNVNVNAATYIGIAIS
jgi:hypothetical protein